MLSKQRMKTKKGFFIFFFYFFFLLGFISLAFVWDFSKVITARHQALSFTDSLSMAGATGVVSRGSRIEVDTTRARSRVADTYFAGVSADVVSNVLAPIGQGAWIPTVPSTRVNGNTVTVTSRYRVCGLYIIGILANRSTCFESTVTSSTELCSSANNQDCAYPLRL